MKMVRIALALAVLPLGSALGCRRPAIAAGDDTARLIGQLKDPDAGKRQEAAFSLGNSPQAAKAAVGALTETLRDGEYSVRSQAAQTLGKAGPDAATAVPALVQAMQKDSVASVRGYAAWALGQIGPGAAASVPALIDALSDREVAEEAAQALGEMGQGAAAAKRLREIVNDKTVEPRTRAGALMGLKHVGDRKDAVALMIAAIEDRAAPPELRRTAALAVGHIGFDGGEEAKAAVPALLAHLGDKEVLHSGPWSLWALGATDKAVARLIQLLGHKDHEIRAQAASGLVHMAGGNAPPEAKAAVPALIQALEVKDDARATVIAALGDIGPDAREALPALMPLLKDDDRWTRDRVNEAIKKIAPDE